MDRLVVGMGYGFTGRKKLPYPENLSVDMCCSVKMPYTCKSTPHGKIRKRIPMAVILSICHRFLNDSRATELSTFRLIMELYSQTLNTHETVDYHAHNRSHHYLNRPEKRMP